jgi:hypothetical protein
MKAVNSNREQATGTSLTGHEKKVKKILVRNAQYAIKASQAMRALQWLVAIHNRRLFFVSGSWDETIKVWDTGPDCVK